MLAPPPAEAAAWHRAPPVVRAAPLVMPAALVVGLIAATAIPPTPFRAGVLCAVAIAIAVATRAGRLAMIAMLLCGAGWLWGAVRVVETAPATLSAPTLVSGIVSVDDPPRRRPFGGWTARVRVERGDGGGGLAVGSRLLADGQGSQPRRGDLIRVNSARVQGAVTPRSPEWWPAYVERQRIAGRIRIASTVVVGSRGGLRGIRDGLSTWAQHSAGRGLEGDRAGLVRGMAFGGSDGLSDQADDDFRAAGLAHLVAVSGQNIAVVATAVIALLRSMGTRRRVALVVAACCIVAYCVACEGGASVGRAAVAGVLGVVAELRSSPRERWYLLLVGLAILLCVQPRAIGDPGLQLSFSAVAGIFVFSGEFTRRASGWVGVRLSGLVGLAAAASLSTAPALVWHFGQLSIVGLALNVVAVPLAAPIVVLALMGTIVGAVVPPLGLLATLIAGIGAEVLLVIAHVGAAIPGASVALPSSSAVPIAVGVILLAGVVHRTAIQAGFATALSARR